MKAVKSSHIEKIHYEPITKVLAVHFKGNKIYHYSGVSPETYNDFEKSPSHGEFLHKNIIPKHRALKK